MPVQVHSEYLQRRFVASWCSVACFVNFLIVAGAGILPLYIAWASNSFWIKEAVRWEQPAIEFRNELIVAVSGRAGASNSFYRLWTTSPAANDLIGNAAAVTPVVKSSTSDFNLDGRPDELHLAITVPLSTIEYPTSVTVLAFVEAKLTTVTRMQMDGVLVASHTSGVSGSSFVADGDVVFRQRDSLPYAPDGIYTPYLRSPLTPLAAPTSIQDVLPNNILREYRSRNHTVELSVPYAIWEEQRPDYSMPPYVDVIQAVGRTVGRKSFDIRVTARIPPTAVRVRPGVTEELKHGWIQYVSFLVITVVAAWVLRKLVFGLHIVETAIFADTPRAKLHLE